jgi:DNA-binding transcriptional MerR regulator
MAKEWVYSKEIVKIYNIPYSTLTHYTNLGFFTVHKAKGNKRLYDKKEVGMHLRKIIKLVNAGYPLRLIKKKLNA